MVVLVSLGLLIFCMRRTNNNKDASADTELTSVTEANRVNEEIREDRRSRSPPEASSASVYANFTKPTETTSDHSLTTAASSQHEANRVNEEIREDRRSRSPPEASSASVYANFTKPTETTSDHSLTTAASSQHKTEDDLSKLIYSQVDFSNAATALLHSGHVTSGHANDVIYSVLQVQESSDRHHTGDSSPPLYSVISKH
ncbi:uncharacterized protein LOC122981697 isoform X1 [Thunnus albacares]|uniref:uncharacterized protein LOC122981697 isoform X1 n=1 Tax=Thunnus albacares TaxID=8236 RepID=UPI001CF654C1|nr:uncharacterized protein LOC122981697 isoform X1 [Thunnus albacares]